MAVQVRPHSGDLTFYNLWANAPVSCQHEKIKQSDLLSSVAVSQSFIAGGSTCGTCLMIHGPLGSLKARVVDTCMGCAADDLDLSAQAFAIVADPAAGRLHSIQWEVVSCETSQASVPPLAQGTLSKPQAPTFDVPGKQPASKPSNTLNNDTFKSTPAAAKLKQDSRASSAQIVPAVQAKSSSETVVVNPFNVTTANMLIGVSSGKSVTAITSSPAITVALAVAVLCI